MDAVKLGELFDGGQQVLVGGVVTPAARNSRFNLAGGSAY